MGKITVPDKAPADFKIQIAGTTNLRDFLKRETENPGRVFKRVAFLTLDRTMRREFGAYFTHDGELSDSSERITNYLADYPDAWLEWTRVELVEVDGDSITIAIWAKDVPILHETERGDETA